MLKRALISVSDKTGVVDFARGLHELGVEIISTGGTFKAIQEAGIPVRQVSEVAGFPEILDGRVKTLQPGIHGGILAMRNNPEHMRQIAAHGITPIDLVCVNLYPFRETVAKPGVTLEEAIENIDIGGPAMVRSAAKNHPDVVIVVDPAKYGEVLSELQASGDLSYGFRFELALAAYQHTAAYDAAISQWLDTKGRELAQAKGVKSQEEAGFPQEAALPLRKVQELRYGENPHQSAAFYTDGSAAGPSLVNAKQHQGKELSFNNINDAHAALSLVQEFAETAVVAIKHANPCGVAVGGELVDAYKRAHDADPVSIFGGVIAMNRVCDRATAEEIVKIFSEIIIAPDFTPDALDVFRKKPNLRVLSVGHFGRSIGQPAHPVYGGYDVKRVAGGFLLQTWDDIIEDPAQWKPVTERQEPGLLADAEFGWKVVKHTKSNTIIVAKNGVTLGVGCGQVNRIDAARHALKQAGEAARGAVLTSDAFFPFPDVVEAAAEAGIALIVQPGGSINDKLSIQRANELGVAMLLTGVRHFKH